MKEMIIEILYDNVETTELKHFFASSVGYTIFHDPLFLGYHSKDKFAGYKEFMSFSLIFKMDDNVVAFLPGASYIDEEENRIFKSPFYSSFGGFVVSPKIDFQLSEKIVDAAISFFQEHQYKKIFIGLTPSCYFGDAYFTLNYFNFILLSKGFMVSGSDLLLVRPLSADNFSDLDYSIKKQLRQAEKNQLTFKDATIDEKVYGLLVSNRKKFDATPTHTLDELSLINKLMPDTIKVFKTMHGEKMVAAAIIFKANEEVVNTFYLFDDEQYRDLRAMQYTYYKVIEWAAQNNFKFIDFGPSTFGFTPHHNLIHYKEKFGGKPFLRNTFSKTLN
jgi:hypothetical protein